jgi:hypothetical protein
MANSADAPFSITYNRETMAVVGKYTWLSVAPDSYSARPSGKSTDSGFGNQRSQSEAGRLANSPSPSLRDIRLSPVKLGSSEWDGLCCGARLMDHRTTYDAESG